MLVLALVTAYVPRLQSDWSTTCSGRDWVTTSPELIATCADQSEALQYCARQLRRRRIMARQALALVLVLVLVLVQRGQFQLQICCPPPRLHGTPQTLGSSSSRRRRRHRKKEEEEAD